MVRDLCRKEGLTQWSASVRQLSVGSAAHRPLSSDTSTVSTATHSIAAHHLPPPHLPLRVAHIRLRGSLSSMAPG